MKSQQPTLFSEVASLSSTFKNSLSRAGFEKMTPVQQRVLNEVFPNEENAVVQAKTGTGKTLAFLLVAFKDVLKGKPRLNSSKIHSVILSPTRELALQIFEEARKLTYGTGIRVSYAIGGNSKMREENAIRRGNANLLIATPGRLEDHLQNPRILESLSTDSFILDEADRLMDMGFAESILNIHEAVTTTKTRKLCFSATMPPKVSNVFRGILGTDFKLINCLDPNEPPTHERVPQFVIETKLDKVFSSSLSLLQQLTSSNPSSRIIVFLPTISMVDFVGGVLENHLKVPCFILHSGLTTAQRRSITESFRKCQSGILFATDVVARGMDFPNITQVVQITGPSNTDDYIHRIGRTGRAGKTGEAYLILLEQEKPFLNSIKHLPLKQATIEPLSDQALSTLRSDIEKSSKFSRTNALKTLYGSKPHVFSGSSQRRATGKNIHESAIALFSLHDVPGLMEELIYKSRGRGSPKGFRGSQLKYPSSSSSSFQRRPRSLPSRGRYQQSRR